MSIYISFFFIFINFEECKNILLKGKRVQDGQFPWLIQFQTVTPCGGVLLSPDWVVTSAQCVQDKRNSISLFATGLNGTNSKQTISVKATYIHPTYEAYSDPPDRDYNIALLKLTKPFNIYHNKIILPNIVPVKYNDNYKLCLIFGWQSYVSPSLKVLAKPIQYHEVFLNSWKMCTYMIKTYTNYTNLFCTMVEYKDEIIACAGNPGSPVVCENQNHEIALVGIASWTNFSLECGDLPTYIDLGSFRTWINDLVFSNKDSKEWKNNSFTENIRMHRCLWNYSDLLQTDSEINHLLNNSKNISRMIINYQNSSSKNIAKETSNITYRYKEIGNSEDNSQSHIWNLNKKKQFSTINKSLLCNNRQFHKDMIKGYNNQVDIDDVELLLPFNFEEISSSYSCNIMIYPKKLYLFYYFIFWNVYIIIYTYGI